MSDHQQMSEIQTDGDQNLHVFKDIVDGKNESNPFPELEEPVPVAEQVFNEKQEMVTKKTNLPIKEESQKLLGSDEYLPQDHPDRYPGHFSMFLVYLMSSFSVACFSYIIPVSVEFTKFLGQTQFMAGFVIAIACWFSAFTGPPAYLLTLKYGLRKSFIACTTFFIVGMFLYVVSCPAKSFALLIIARCIMGVGAQLIPYWYSSRAVGINKRTTVNQYINASVASGYSLGPLIASLMYVLSKNDVDRIPGTEDVTAYHNIWWNRVTAPAWLIIILLIIQQALIVCYLKEPSKETNETSRPDDIEAKENTPLQGILRLTKKEKIALSANLVATFCLPIVISGWEVVSVNEAVFTWGWPIEIAALYVGLVFLFLIPATIILARLMAKMGMQDRTGMALFGGIAVAGFFFLWDYFQVQSNVGIIICYTTGSFILLVGFNLARGFCWSIISKQVPTHSKGLVNMLLFVVYMFGRGAGALIADCFRTDIQSHRSTDYWDEQGFVAWSPRNTYAWSMQLTCLFVTLLWLGLYKINVPCQGSS